MKVAKVIVHYLQFSCFFCAKIFDFLVYFIGYVYNLFTHK
ncbi:hypothetical protein CLONEX_00961 [[Clostridium] nexile DSM 1787]|nr:hypothetical protein CLONEX_00961 [[Clostridium] nexile DSM 1787]